MGSNHFNQLRRDNLQEQARIDEWWESMSSKEKKQTIKENGFGYIDPKYITYSTKRNIYHLIRKKRKT